MVLLVLSASLPEARAVRVGRNVNITGNIPRQVVEPAIAVDPRNPNIIVAGAEDRRLVPPGGCPGSSGCHTWGGYYRSTDGGVTWSSSLLPGFPGDTSPAGSTSPLRLFDHIGHESVVFDRAGNVYYSGFVVKLDDSGSFISSSMRIAVTKFANDGADFVGTTVLSSGPGILPRMTVDTSGGPNDGNVYVTFLDSESLGYKELFTRSTDGGQTFSKPIPIPGSGLPVAPTVDPAGNVFVESVHCTGNSLQCSSDASATILVNKSTDGGSTFDKSVVVAAIKAPPDPLPGNPFFRDAFTGVSWDIAADANGVYTVWDDYGTGDSNVLFTKSTDGGLTWSSPLRVNDVTQGQQFFSRIAVSGGIISVIWYDSRLGQLSNGTITSLDVFYSESRDGGSSFSTNVRVTSASFDPNLVNFGDFNIPFQFIGDRIGIAASATAVHPIWTDNRNGCDNIDPAFGCVDQDIFTATIIP